MKSGTACKRKSRLIGAVCAGIAAGVMGQSTIVLADTIYTGPSSASTLSSANITFSNITQTLINSETDIGTGGVLTLNNGSPPGSYYSNPVGGSGPTANYPVVYHGTVAEFPSAGTLLGLEFKNLNNDAGLTNTGRVYAAQADGTGIAIQTIHVVLQFDVTYPKPQAAPTIKAFEYGGSAFQAVGATVTLLSGTLKVTAKPNGVLSSYTATSNVIDNAVTYDPFGAPTYYDSLGNPTADSWTASASTNDSSDPGPAASTFHVSYDTILTVSSPYVPDTFAYGAIDKGNVLFSVPGYVAPPDGGSTPEPATLGMLGIGSVVLMARRRNKR